MLRFHKLLPLLIAAVGVSMMGMPTHANAAFQLTISTTAGSQTFTDNGAGDSDARPNQLTVTYFDAAYNTIQITAVTNQPGTASNAFVTFSFNVDSTGTTGGAATVTVSDTGFTQPTLNPLTLTSNLTGQGFGPGGSISLSQYADTNNGQATTSGPGVVTPGLQGPFFTSSHYDSTASVKFNSTGTYSITDVLSFNLSPSSQTGGNVDSRVTPAPAPAGLLLVLSGLPLVGAYGWMRRRKALQLA